ncbi:DUF721 domain-containing protein [Fusobacterium massiliense]|jgi:hypothetical protein|uniref:hypothetical protein n=1 Tax=Fusobacterium massiliense TaxID=1852365 RepID=UPI00093F83E4|nr:hypothetical protein [Fusobacterium massiliense]
MKKIHSIAEIVKFNILTDDNIKRVILATKWKEFFKDLSELSEIVNFRENIIYLKTYDSTLKHYIFINKKVIIEKILESLEIKFEIEDIKFYTK